MDANLPDPVPLSIEYQSPDTARVDRLRLRLAHDCLVLGWFALILIVPADSFHFIFSTPLEYLTADAALLLLGLSSLRIRTTIRRCDIPGMRRAVVAGWFSVAVYVYVPVFGSSDGETRFYLAAVAMLMVPLMLVIVTLTWRVNRLIKRIERMPPP
jgi:peptidoglycan/LPS O-acetylase OafA/YrhL